MRVQGGIEFNFTGLLAGINVAIFAITTCCVFILAVIMSINEKCQPMSERNHIWQIFHVLMPGNTKELAFETGWTRRILILTCGFTVLLSTTYYQCNLLPQL